MIGPAISMVVTFYLIVDTVLRKIVDGVLSEQKTADLVTREKYGM